MAWLLTLAQQGPRLTDHSATGELWEEQRRHSGTWATLERVSRVLGSPIDS